MVLTSATTPPQYLDALGGWGQRYVQALRQAVVESAPELDERLKWGHLV